MKIKLKISHKDIILYVQWKKYQNSEIYKLEYVKKIGLKN